MARSNRQIRKNRHTTGLGHAIMGNSSRTITDKISEQMLVNVFQFGEATPDHLKKLIDMGNMMRIAADMMRDKTHLKVVERIYHLEQQIRSRKIEVGSYVLRTSELKLLKEIVATYDRFWMNKSQGLYDTCQAELMMFKREVEERKLNNERLE